MGFYEKRKGHDYMNRGEKMSIGVDKWCYSLARFYLHEECP